MCAFKCMYTYDYVHLYIYIYTHTHIRINMHAYIPQAYEQQAPLKAQKMIEACLKPIQVCVAPSIYVNMYVSK